MIFDIDEVKDFWLACIENGQKYRNKVRTTIPNLSLIDFRLDETLPVSRPTLDDMISRARANHGIASNVRTFYLLRVILVVCIVRIELIISNVRRDFYD